ncbi:short chain dehydrogenase [Vibrio thalassae]|uniref:Short chain dehydrogenase n=1 Tax=Vibrio thalassae TaxID=1243014 RepID=A0A240EID8_9VIBR|nr:hypothetical protein [Vibrio thalassae]SNX47939.1 short chain dehydrogenase [Vibrio thalassae]
MNREKTIYVILGGASGIEGAIAQLVNHEEKIAHVASRSNDLDISNEKEMHCYFESIGTFDHLIVTAGSAAPAGKVKQVTLEHLFFIN